MRILTLLLLPLGLTAQANPYADWTITTIAGSGPTGDRQGGNSGIGGPATEARLNSPTDVYTEASGTVLFRDRNGYFRVTSDGVLEPVSSIRGSILGQRPNGNFLLQDVGAVNEHDAEFRFLRRFRTLPQGSDCNLGVRESTNGVVYCMNAHRELYRLNAEGASSFGTRLRVAMGQDFATDSTGRVYLYFSYKIVRIGLDGVATDLTNSRFVDFGDGQGSSVSVSEVGAMAMDPQQNLVFAESTLFLSGLTSNPSVCRIRAWLRSSARVVTLTHTNGRCEFSSGESGPAALANVHVNALVSGLAIGRSGEINFADTTNHRVRRLSPPISNTPSLDAIVSAASYQAGGVAPGEIITVFGSRVGPSTLLTAVPSSSGYPTSLANVRLLFDGVAAPLLYVSPNQLSGIIPFSAAGKPTVTLSVENGTTRSADQSLAVVPGKLALFTLNGSGTGPAAALNQDGSVNTASTPARRGSIIILFATGLGLVAPALRDGQIAGTTLSRTVTPLRVLINGVEGTVHYAGSAPGLVAGVYQLNVELPSQGLPTGLVSVQLQTSASQSIDRTTIHVLNQ